MTNGTPNKPGNCRCRMCARIRHPSHRGTWGSIAAALQRNTDRPAISPEKPR